MNSLLAGLRPVFIAGTLGQGGAEMQLFHILSALKQSGAEPKLICLTEGEFWEPRIAEAGIPTIHAGKARSRPLRAATIARIARSCMPDVVQSQHFYTNLYACAAARIAGAPEIGAIRNDVTSEVRSNGRILGNLSLRLPRLLAANSHAAIRTAVSLGISESRLFHLPNVVDTDRFRPAGDRRDCGRPVRIVSLGRLVEQKRFDRLLRILGRLKINSPVPFEARIYGDGPLRAPLRSQAAGMGLSREVEFVGLTADPREAYAEADIFMLTSDWEGTPNVVLEAMSSGLPTVATGAGDIPEIIDDRTDGFVYHIGDEEGMAAGLRELIADPGLRLSAGAAARKKMVETRSPAALPGILQDLYLRAIR